MLQWLTLIALVMNLFLSLSATVTEADCKASSATSRLECSRFDIDETNKCCLFTAGVEKVNSCSVVDLSTVATIEASVKAFKETLQDQENISFDCGSKIEQCLQIKSPYSKTSCTKIQVEYNHTCCMMSIDNVQSCYPLKADTIEDIENFAKEYEANQILNSTPSVLCRSLRLHFALISLFIFILTLF